MSNRLSRLSKLLINRLIWQVRGPTYKSASYSQFGEDRILWNMLAPLGTPPGFFVDVGAHHPQRFSNTYLFYEIGWRGVNIDPLPGTKTLFAKYRPRDITLECGVSSEPGSLNYYMFSDPAWNTFTASKLAEIEARGGPKHLETREIPVTPLARLLDQHLPNGQAIDFLTVDVEGFDLQVLQSNDWTRYCPRFVVVEDGNMTGDVVDVHTSLESPTSAFLIKQGYKLVGWTNGSAIWADRR